MYAVQLICTNFFLLLSVMNIKQFTFDILYKPIICTGITRKELTNVDIQEQTASFMPPDCLEGKKFQREKSLYISQGFRLKKKI